MTRPTTFLTQEFTEIAGPVPGDCWRAAVACLIGVPSLDGVPHFMAIDMARGDPESTGWWSDTVAWVAAWLAADTEYLHSPYDELTLCRPQFPVYEPPTQYPHVIATGPSPRGDFLHSVIVDSTTGELVWDPHPSRAGLAGPPVELVAMGCRR